MTVRGRLLLVAAGAAVVAPLSACGRLDELPYEPPTTPEQWCAQRPCVDVGDAVVNEPFGTVLVLALTMAWFAAGIWLWRARNGQRSRSWLAVALVLGGAGALLAGISYQAFSYELKCAGRDLCVLTSGYEVGYNLVQAASVSAMVVAVAFATTGGVLHRALVGYAAANVAVYTLVTAAGVLLPSAALLSFPVLMLFALPGVLLVLAVAGHRYHRQHDPLDRSLVVAAVLLVVVQVAYFAYYASGLTEALWADGDGWYVSANEVLHLGMLGWLWYVVRGVAPHLRDVPAWNAVGAPRV